MNPQGAIEKEVVINDQIIVNNYGKSFSMNYLGQGNGLIILGITTKSAKDGVVYFDTGSMKAVKQAICSFTPQTAENDVIAGKRYYDDEIVVSKMIAGTKQELKDGTEIEVCNLGSGHDMEVPLRYEEDPFAIRIYNNYLYLISGEGFYKAKLTATKFKQLYGISKLSHMQDVGVKFMLTMKNEKEIYFITEKTEDEKTSYTFQIGTIG